MMSDFTVRTPTWEEVNDEDELKVTHVHMTLTTPWDPNDEMVIKLMCPPLLLLVIAPHLPHLLYTLFHC